jgi:hypothetical protein
MTAMKPETLLRMMTTMTMLLLMRLLLWHERCPPCSSLPQARRSCSLQQEHCDMCELKSVTW